MKLNKTFGRIATTLVATAMLASVAVVPAFAVTVNNDGVITDDENPNKEAITEISFTKYLVTPDYVTTAPDVTFAFDLEGVAPAIVDGKTETVSSGEGDSEQSITVSSGVGHGTNLSATAVFTTDNEDDVKDELGLSENDVNAYKATVTFTGIDATSLNITQPGVYKYELTEDFAENSTVNKAAYTLATDQINGEDYYVYLYVQRLDSDSDALTVTGAELAVAAENQTKSTKVDNLVNYYMVDPESQETIPSTLTVKKNVTGTMGDKSEDFTFTVVIDPVDNDARSYGYSGDATYDAEASDAAQHKFVFKVSHNETFTINGLMPGDDYTITETSVADEGYETPVVNWAEGCNSDDTSIVGDTLKDGATVTFSDKDGADSIVYTNTREAVSPTGLVMDIAPYALLVIVAAAGCFVFLRKRRED